nr:MAG TPA: hypothetical protein [Caudoviricetes sp.]
MARYKVFSLPPLARNADTPLSRVHVVSGNHQYFSFQSPPTTNASNSLSATI